MLQDGSGNGIAVIILAAGSSSRMGRSKQLVKIAGEALLIRAIKTAHATNAGRILIVLGADAKRHQDAISSFPVSIITNEQWQKGMGTSLKAAMTFILGEGWKTDGVLVMVCDQPLITGEHLLALVDRSRQTKKRMIASWYGGAPGVPAFFHRSVFNRLLEIGDDAGAKIIFRNYPDELETVSFPDGAFDIDTEKDLADFLHKYQK
jgi:molybdenum cofactor cytidylyltransferase